MFEKFSFTKINKAVAIALRDPRIKKEETFSSLEELKLLAKTLNIEVVNTFIQTKDKVNPAYYIGRGKLLEIKNYIDKNGIDAIIFDNELTGIQERNIEKILNKPIFNRTEIILTIFNKKAKTSIAKLQVELASLEYMKPRLKNRWDHFSRVEGGIGLRGGEGEKQLELDRRMIQNQIDKIKLKLEKVDTQMKTRRKRRLKQNIVTLIGYTNAGKSTLFNKLTKSSTPAENKLFSTLDTTSRRLYLNEKVTIILNDSVGFINNLPHSLINSFKSTLEEISSSSLLLHIIDATSPNIKRQIDAVNTVLNEIGIIDIPIIKVYNKIDLIPDTSFLFTDENSILISALKGEGIDQLKTKIIEFFTLKN